MGIALAQIPATSPTLAELMRSCLLRAGLARSPDAAQYVLGNPKIWLGTAYHTVLEKIAQAGPVGTSVETEAASLWEEAVKSLSERARAHTLDRRFGTPQSWPGYYVARASVILRAQEIIGSRRATQPTPLSSSDTTIRERKFVACSGKLVGRPDVIRNKEIIDYKTGGIIEHDDDSQGKAVRTSYVRQLRIYGYLVRKILGWWPERGILVPMVGPGVEIELEPEDCEREAAEAVELLNIYNDTIASDTDLINLARPSANTCKWCSYKIICSSFWTQASPGWSASLDGIAVEGRVTGTQIIHGGAAIAITVKIEGGTETPRSVQIAPLNPATHTSVTALAKGERVRLTGLGVRPDGAMAPTQRTVIMRTEDLPNLRAN